MNTFCFKKIEKIREYLVLTHTFIRKCCKYWPLLNIYYFNGFIYTLHLFTFSLMGSMYQFGEI